MLHTMRRRGRSARSLHGACRPNRPQYGMQGNGASADFRRLVSAMRKDGFGFLIFPPTHSIKKRSNAPLFLFAFSHRRISVICHAFIDVRIINFSRFHKRLTNLLSRDPSPSADSGTLDGGCSAGIFTSFPHIHTLNQPRQKSPMEYVPGTRGIHNLYSKSG